jgi:hypothetical protein
VQIVGKQARYSSGGGSNMYVVVCKTVVGMVIYVRALGCGGTSKMQEGRYFSLRALKNKC